MLELKQILKYFVIPLKFCTMSFTDCFYIQLTVCVAEEKNRKKVKFWWEKVAKIKYKKYVEKSLKCNYTPASL